MFQYKYQELFFFFTMINIQKKNKIFIPTKYSCFLNCCLLTVVLFTEQENIFKIVHNCFKKVVKKWQKTLNVKYILVHFFFFFVFN